MGRNVFTAAVSVFVFLPSLSCTQYLEPRPREVCFWVIYHRHPGLPVCLITPGSTKSQSASGPAARGALCVCIGAYTAHIFPSKFNDGIAYRMCFLFKKVKQKWLVGKTRSIGRIFSKGGQSLQYMSSAVILKIHENITKDACQDISKRDVKKLQMKFT